MDIVQAILIHLRRVSGRQTTWTLCGGSASDAARIYRTQAPKVGQDAHAGSYPHIVITDMGGPIHRVFGGKNIEEAELQFSVYDLFGEDGSRARTIWAQLAGELENARLPVVGSASILIQRNGRPREVVEDFIICVNGDWRVLSQVSI